MKIIASSDLHLDQAENFAAFERDIQQASTKIEQDSVLILGGDVCETTKQLDTILGLLSPKFSDIVWLPGNHELWIRPSQQQNKTGVQAVSSETKYKALLEVCHRHGVHTPEDTYLHIKRETQKDLVIAPLFLLYDYSFRPDSIPLERAIDWAMESDVMCSDEVLIVPHPYQSIPDWCQQRITYTQSRLAPYKNRDDIELVLVNHFPLKESSFHLQTIPRFSIWCGTKATENWHKDYPVRAVVSGHLHLPGHQQIDGVDFHEVSLGYPGQWNNQQSILDSFIELPY